MKYFVKNQSQLPSSNLLPRGHTLEYRMLTGKYVASGHLSEKLEPGDQIIVLTGREGILSYTLKARQQPSLLHRPLIKCGFTAKVQGLLFHGGRQLNRMMYLEDLLACSTKDLEGITGFGPTAVDEVKRVLGELGLFLKPRKEMINRPLTDILVDDWVLANLKAAKIEYVYHLIQTTEKALRNKTNLKRRDITKLKEMLVEWGICLRPE